MESGGLFADAFIGQSSQISDAPILTPAPGGPAELVAFACRAAAAADLNRSMY